MIDGSIGVELIDKITSAPNSKAFRTPVHLKGQKIRMNNPIFVETMNATGGILMIVFSFIGGAAVYRANVHIAVQALLDAVSPRARPVLQRLVDVASESRG